MTNLDENPFSTTDPIFDTKQVLKKDELPDKIFHRDDEIQEAITAHANGTDGTRALSPGSDDESGKGPPQLDTRLADDLDMTPRDSM